MAKKTARASLTPKLISLAVASCFATSAALANPTGPAVVNGQVTISQAGSLLQITNSPNAIINWQSFSIGASELTRFLQQSGSSAVLNRVVGAGGAIDPSVILGALQSNGRVFLINPSGVLFGAGSQVDVAGLVASSLNLSNQDFLAGKLRFTEVPGAGAVVNQGAINAGSGGQVYLVGPSVTNSGIITTPKGEVVLAAGNSVELVNPGTPNLRVEITAPDNEARNLGQIVADAGRVGIYAGLIDQKGTIRADSAVVGEDGRILLKAIRNITLEAGSSITANGPSGGQVTIQSGETTLVSGSIEATGSAGKGGTVQVLGNLVGLVDNASIDASGETGGGTVLVGGDFQGKNSGIQNAFRTYFGPHATVSADAIGSGDGGKVIVWSDDATRAYGNISARGGSRSGDGGFVEVSGKKWLDFQARVDTRAANGKMGTLLLDPADVEIGVSSFTSGGTPSSVGSGGLFSGGSGISQLTWAGVDSALDFSNVIITTDGSGGPLGGTITVVDPSPNLTMLGYLALVAHNDVVVNGSISGNGDLRLYAGWDQNASPLGSLAGTGPVVTQGVGNIAVNQPIDMLGNVLLRAGNNIDVNVNSHISAGSSFSASNRSLTLDAGNRLQVFGNLDVSAGEGHTATLGLFAGAGGILVDGGAGSILISATSIDTSSCCSGRPGGSAVMNMTTSGGGPVTIRNSTINVSAGRGGTGSSESGNAGGRGGDATFAVATGGAVSIMNSTINVSAGGGGSGGSACCGNGITAAPGGAGGTATLTMNAGPISVSGSFFNVTGGSGGSGGRGFEGSRGGDGGIGGDAIFTTNAGPVTMTGSSVNVRSGRGGSGGNASGSGSSAGRGGNGGIGGNATFTMNAAGSVLVTGVSSFDVSAGSGGRGGSITFGSGRGGDGGIGGGAIFTMNAAGPVSLDGSSLFVSAGNGGGGGGASSGGRGGDGGNGGSATLSVTSTVIGNTISLTGSSINVNGGRGGRGGNAFSGGSSSSSGGGGGVGGNGGRGGNATATLTATNISFTDSSLRVRSGGFGSSGGGSLGSGIAGRSGDAMATLSAGGNLSVQNSFIQVGAEGAAGGSAVLTMAANGSMTIGGASIIETDATFCCSPAPTSGDGGAAQTTLIGGSIRIDGFSTVSATGATGAVNGGAASVNLIAAAGSLVIDGAEGITATGGIGTNKGGDAALTLAAVGPISITDSGPSTGGVGIVATGGSDFFGGQTTGGNASVLIGSLAGVSSTRSHIASAGGAATVTGGSAVTLIAAGGGNLTLDGSGAAPLTVQAVGGSASALGGIGGTAETDLLSVGTTFIISEGVFADGGSASQGRGGDSFINAAAGGGFSMLNSTVGSFGGFGGQQGGNASLAVAASSIRIESTSTSPATLIASGGSSGTTGILGSATADLSAGGPTGQIDIVNERVDVSGGARGSGSTAVFGPGTINLTFPGRTSGGFAVNGMDGAIVGVTSTTSNQGFFVNGIAAIPDVNFFLFYGSPAGAPSFDAQLISSLNNLADLLTGEKKAEEGVPGDDKDKKKKANVCK